jgi:hypothetical protein
VLDPARDGAREVGFREAATSATITGTAKYPLLVDVERGSPATAASPATPRDRSPSR